MTSHGVNYEFSHSDCLLIIEILSEDNSTNSQSTADLHRLADKGSNRDELICMEEWFRVAKHRVNSSLLGEKSRFFHNLFANAATMESVQKSAFLRIQACEESAFMELLNYMHTGTLTSATTAAPALLAAVLKSADKFEVVSCLRLCASLLTEMPLTMESASLILDLTSSPNNMAFSDEVQQLIDAAKHLLAREFYDIPWNVMNKISVDCLEAILSLDALECPQEDFLFPVLRGWLTDRYPKAEDQREIFSTRLARYIRFPYVSTYTLEHVLRNKEGLLEEDFVRKVVMDALLFKATTPFDRYHDPNILDRVSATHRGYVRRNYALAPIRSFEFEYPCQEVVTYLDLPMPVSIAVTEDFRLGANYFHLTIGNFRRCSPLRFSVVLENDEGTAVTSTRYEPLALEYEFAVRSKCTKKFISKSGGPIDLGISWTLYETPMLDFDEGKSLDFIDGVIYIELKLRRRINSIGQ